MMSIGFLAELIVAYQSAGQLPYSIAERTEHSWTASAPAWSQAIKPGDFPKAMAEGGNDAAASVSPQTRGQEGVDA